MQKIIILLLILLQSTFISAQDDNDYSISINHLALSVSDLNASAEFYKQVLKLSEITTKTKTDGIRWFSLGEGKELHLIPILIDNITINKTVQFVLSTSNFDAFINKLKSMKIIYSDWLGNTKKIFIRADGIKQVFFQDPDGYWIEVNSVANKQNQQSLKNDNSEGVMSELTPKVTGIGGIFFKTKNPKESKEWYGKNLGLAISEYGSSFEFRNANRPEEINYLQWSPFADNTDYFNPSTKEFMINYRVQNIEGLVKSLKENGVTVVDEIESYDYGKFVHILDNDGNKIELWEPVDSVFTAMGGETTK